MSVPRASVLITLYNRPRRMFHNTLHQLRRNDLRNTEVVIVDDGSTKDYSDMQSYCEQHEMPVKWIRIEKDPTCYSIDGYNTPVRAWNTALDAASGEIIVTLASDCLIPPHAMNHARRPGKAIWMCAVTDIDTCTEFLGRTRMAPLGWFMSWNRSLYDVRWDDEYMKGIAFDDNDFTARLALAAKTVNIDLGITAFHQSHPQTAYSDGLRGHEINERYTWKKWGGVPWKRCQDDPIVVKTTVTGSTRVLYVSRKDETLLEQHGVA